VGGSRFVLGAAVANRTAGARRPGVVAALTPRRRPADRLTVLADEGKGDLALRVDVLDEHLHVVAEVEHVLDALDPLARSQLGDVQEAVPPGEDVDEGAELGDVDDLARVDGAYLGARGVEDQLDAASGLVDGRGLLGADGHPPDAAVVVDGDVGAGLLLEGVDHLALRADHLADLVHRDLEADDLGGIGLDAGGRLGDGAGNHVEDRVAGVAGLLQRLGEHLGGDAVDLGVELQGGDELAGPGHLEVHVTEGVLGTEDVGEGGVATFGVDEAHGDAADGGLDRHAGVHQRERRAADRGHRGRAVGGEHVGDDAKGVGELLLGGHHREQRALGEQAVADLAALGSAHEARLAGGEGREVVVVDVALGVVDADRVEQLVHPRHAEGGHREHLGVAALEQARPVRRRQQADLGRERADVARPPAVDAHTLLDDALAHDLLGVGAHRCLDLALLAGELLGELAEHRVGGSVEGGTALGLGGDGVGLGQLVGTDGDDALVDLLGVVDEQLIGDRRLGAGTLDELALRGDGLADPDLGGLEALGDHFLGDLGRAILVVLPRLLGPAGLDHHDRNLGVTRGRRGPGDLAPGYDELEGRAVALLVARVGQPFALGRVRQAHRSDRAVEGDPREHQCRRRAVDRNNVVRVDLIGAQDRPDDVHLVAEALREGGTQRAVDQPGGERRLVGSAALTAEERAGDLARGVHPLLDVHGEREEVLPLAHLSCRGGGDEDDGVADTGQHGPVGLLCKLACLERQAAVGPTDRGRHGNGLSHVSPSGLGRLCSRPVPSRRAPDRAGDSATGSWSSESPAAVSCLGARFLPKTGAERRADRHGDGRQPPLGGDGRPDRSGSAGQRRMPRRAMRDRYRSTSLARV
jgi:hypothetical protein